MLEQIRAMFSEDIDQEEELWKVQKFLISKSERLSLLSLFELDELWRRYSGELCASFLYVSEDSLDDFNCWLEDRIN